MKFKAWLVENRISQKELAELLGVSVVAVNRKLNGVDEFTVRQIRTICEKYGLSADEFFFADCFKNATKAAEV